jgi:hypothetical protein
MRCHAAGDAGLDGLGAVVGGASGAARPGGNVPAGSRVDAGLLVITRRDPPLLPIAVARSYADFVRREWSFAIMTA